MPLRIGFVDHHLNNYHADVFIKMLRDGRAGETVEVVAAWESDPIGDDWCAKHGVPRAASPEAVAEEADCLMVLAPDNIGEHVGLCRRILPAGKPTFLDKFLAPDLVSAGEIVGLARQTGTPLLCCSALRYPVELDELLAGVPLPVGEMFSRGMGGWSGYGIHSVSPVVRAMGGAVRRLIDVGGPDARVVAIDYGDGRRATIDVRNCANGYEALPWELGIRVGDRYRRVQVKDFESFYANQLRAVLEFFRTGEPDISLDDALGVVAILEGAERSQKAGGVWVDIG